MKNMEVPTITSEDLPNYWQQELEWIQWIQWTRSLLSWAVATRMIEVVCYLWNKQMLGKFSATFSSQNQWPFQEPKLEVPTKYTAYIRPMWGNIPAKYGLVWYSNVQHLHFRIVNFPLTKNGKVMVVNFWWMHRSITEIMSRFRCKLCS